VDALFVAAGGEAKLTEIMARIVRDNIDRVIQTPKTGRRLYTDLQNSEKTYIGTAVEIDLRSTLGLARGEDMDLEIAGYDVDVKFSQGKGWMIPPEAVEKPCILVTASDITSLYSLGVIIAHEEYLNKGMNRDAKKTIKAKERANIWWLIQNAMYPKNFWLTVEPAVPDELAKVRKGNQRMMMLFRLVQDRVITRKVIEDVAQQLDPTRRVRADKNRGTRNALETDGILVLSGSKPEHRALAQELGGPKIVKTEYLSHHFQSAADKALAAKYGFTI
jgi:hypothetical protein